MAKNPFKAAQAIEIMRLLKVLTCAKESRKYIIASILAEAGLIQNTPHAKFMWANRRGE